MGETYKDVCIRNLNLALGDAEATARELFEYMRDEKHTDAPCNLTAIHNALIAIDHLRAAERLIETAKRYDPEAEVSEEKSPCYLCANWQRTCKADTCHFIPA